MAGDEDRPTGQGSGTEPVSARREDAVPSSSSVPDLLSDERAGEGRTDGAIGSPSGSRGPHDPGRRSAMPGLLAVIGGILAVLLAANLYGTFNPPTNEAIPALQAESGRLKERVDALGKRPPVDLGPLDARLSDLDGQLATLKAAVERDAGGAAAAAEAKAAVQPLAAELNDLHGALEALAGRVASLPKVDLAPLTSRLDGVESRLPPLEAYFAAPKSGERVTAVRQNGSAAETRAAPVAVIADGVLDALRTGRPFAPEVLALSGLGVDKGVLAPLDAVAETGAATDEALVAGFASVENGIVTAAAPVTTGTMMDRLMANAQSLVKVSRTGAAAGDDAGAVASRIAAALKSGDLTAAQTVWGALPEASRARSAEWADKLRARVAADAAAHMVRRSAIEALAAAVPAP